MTDDATRSNISRRELLGTVSKAAVASIALPPFLAEVPDLASSDQAPLAALAGPDRVVMLQGKTYINGWAGCGDLPGCTCVPALSCPWVR